MGKYFKETKEMIIKLNSSNVREANETYRDLNIQLIFFSATVLSFSLLIFLNKDITNQLDNTEKYLLILTWIFLGLSVIFGIIQFFSTYNFFKKGFNYHNFILSKMGNEHEINKIKEKLNIQEDVQDKDSDEELENTVDKLVCSEIFKESLKKYPDINVISSEIWTKIQVFLIIISLLSLIYFMAKILLNF